MQSTIGPQNYTGPNHARDVAAGHTDRRRDGRAAPVRGLWGGRDSRPYFLTFVPVLVLAALAVLPNAGASASSSAVHLRTTAPPTLASPTGPVLRTTIPVGQCPGSLVFGGTKHDLYVVNACDSTVSIVNKLGNVASTLSFGKDYPFAAAYDASNRQVYLYDQSDNFSVINTTTNSVVAKFPTSYYGAAVEAMLVDPSNHLLYTVSAYVVCCSGVGPGDLDWYSTTGYKWVGNLGLGNVSCGAIGYDPANGEILVGLYNSTAGENEIVAVDDYTHTVVATTSLGSSSVEGFAYDPLTTQMFATLYQNSTVAVYDSGSNTITAWLPVGTHPIGIAYNPIDQDMYIADYGARELSVVGAATDASVATITTGAQPYAVAYDPSMQRICVTNAASGTLSCFGPQEFTLDVSTSVSGGPNWLAYDSAQNAVFVSGGTDNISVLNGTTGLLATTVDVGNATYGIAYDPANGEVYVATGYVGCAVCGAVGSVVVLNATTDAIVNPGIPVGSGALGVAYDPANHDVYVADSSANNVSVIRTATNTLGTTLAVGTFPYAVAYDPLSQSMYVSNAFSGNISVINSSLDAVTKSVYVGGLPTVMTYNPSTHDMYLARPGDSDLAVMNAKSDTYLGAGAAFAGTPFAVQYDPFDHLLFASGPGVVWIVTSGGAPVATVDLGGSPGGLAFDSARSEVCVANSGIAGGSGSVSLINA